MVRIRRLDELEMTLSPYKLARRLLIGLVGTTVLLLGVLMLVLPGPGLLVIPAGLTILGIEFAWARRWLAKIKDGTASVFGRRVKPPG